MDSTARSTVIAVSIALVVISGGCIGASGPGGTSSPSSTAADTPTTGGVATTSTTPAETDNGTSPTGSAGPTTNGDPPAPPTSAPSNELAIRSATWVPTPSGDDRNSPREYITLRYRSIPSETDPQPVNLSGYTVTYGGGPTYTISDNVTLSPTSSAEFYIWTGEGENRAYGEWARSIRSRYILHAGQEGPLLSQDGTIVTVRNRNGTIVSENTVTPMNGTVPFVPTVNATQFIGSMNGSVDTIEEAKNATPFALRAPTDPPAGYQLQGLGMGYTVGLYTYVLSYSQEPDNPYDDLTVWVTAPRNVERMMDRSGSQVKVGNQTGYYATRGAGNNTRGRLQFIGPDGWGYFLNGPLDEQRLIQMGESIEIVEGNATE